MYSRRTMDETWVVTSRSVALKRNKRIGSQTARAGAVATAALAIVFAASALSPQEASGRFEPDRSPPAVVKASTRLAKAGPDGQDAAAPAGNRLEAPADPANVLFVGERLSASAAFSQGPVAPDAERFARRPVQAAAPWREEEFGQVAVEDGRTLIANGVRLQLIGIDLPMPEQVCRTLDGRLELCAVRAATQLELLTRWRPVTCHYRMEGSGEAIGRCRVGTTDLTERMVKSGYTWRSSEALPRI